MNKLPEQVQVVVVGAGPAGSTCARTLAQAGLTVLCIDQVLGTEQLGQCLSATARGLMTELDLLPWLERSAPELVQSGFSCWGKPSLQECEFMQSAYCGGWHLERRRFDSCLRAAAIEAGANFQPTRLIHLQPDDGAWLLIMQAGKRPTQQVRSQWLVDASGRRAICAQRLGMESLRDEPLVALYAAGENRGLDRRSVIEAVPNGWWYSAALPNHRRIAALHVDASEAGKILRQPGLWRENLLASQYLAKLCNIDASWTAPHGCDASGAQLRQCYGDHWLAVGDAAISVDPLVTQGIVNAIATGWRGAQAILAANSGEPESLPRYQRYIDILRQEYRRILLTQYQAEQRWPEQAFWHLRHAAAGPRLPD